MIPEFYKKYIEGIGDNELYISLIRQSEISFKFYKNINKNKLLYAYDSGKWTIKEVLGHVCDAEQIFAFRLLSFSRGEKKSLTGFDENEYVESGNFNDIEWDDLLERFDLLRRTTLNLVKSISSEDLKIIGEANGSKMSLDNLIKVIIGHEKHHRRIIAERYF
jgi:uncharacterized damage-inducible protein DinB